MIEKSMTATEVRQMVGDDEVGKMIQGLIDITINRIRQDGLRFTIRFLPYLLYMGGFSINDAGQLSRNVIKIAWNSRRGLILESNSQRGAREE